MKIPQSRIEKIQKSLKSIHRQIVKDTPGIFGSAHPYGNDLRAALDYLEKAEQFASYAKNRLDEVANQKSKALRPV
jgi:hypothetical protein